MKWTKFCLASITFAYLKKLYRKIQLQIRKSIKERKRLVRSKISPIHLSRIAKEEAPCPYLRPQNKGKSSRHEHICGRKMTFRQFPIANFRRRRLDFVKEPIIQMIRIKSVTQRMTTIYLNCLVNTFRVASRMSNQPKQCRNHKMMLSRFSNRVL